MASAFICSFDKEAAMAITYDILHKLVDSPTLKTVTVKGKKKSDITKVNVNLDDTPPCVGDVSNSGKTANIYLTTDDFEDFDAALDAGCTVTFTAVNPIPSFTW
jgi:hypothetical protein